MPVSVSDLFRIPLFYWIEVASDGRRILYSSNASGRPQLYTSRIATGATPRQITSGHNSVMGGFLSPAGDRVLYLQDEGGNELHHLFLMLEDGTKAERITKDPCRTYFAEWHPNGKEIARTYATQRSCGIDVFDLVTGESFVLREEKAPCLDVRYSHDGKWLAYTEYGGGKDPKSTQVTVVNRSDPRDVIHYKIKDGSKEAFPSWSPDDGRLAFLSDAGGKTEVVIQDFRGEDHFILDLEEGEEVLDQEWVSWAPSGDSVYCIVSKHSRSKVCEHGLSGEKSPLPFPKGTISSHKIDKNGKTVVALHSSMSTPPCIYSCETESSRVTPLTSVADGIDVSKLAKPKSLWYESFDGLRIHSWYLPAKNRKAPRPAVVWPHGGPWWQINDEWSPYIQSFSQSGFDVLAPNFRGSTGYGTEFRNMDISDLGGGDLEDVVAGARWLGEQPGIDKSRIAIQGGSYGGYMTLMALTKKPEVFAAGVAVVPVTDWSEMYELTDASYRRFIEELFEGPPEEKRESYRNSSPITFISQIKAPVLISCARNDSRCPIQPIEKFTKRLEEMKHPHEFNVMEKLGHLPDDRESSVREVTMRLEYLKKTLNIR